MSVATWADGSKAKGYVRKTKKAKPKGLTTGKDGQYASAEAQQKKKAAMLKGAETRRRNVAAGIVKPPAPEIQVELPNDWLPMFEWAKAHYPKQREATESFGKNWETVFIGGNGSGKSFWLYWNLITLCMGVHPYQQLICDPPVRIKVLLVDFEHGLDKVAYETMNFSTLLPTGQHIGPMLPASMISSRPSKEDKSYRFSNGSLIFFMTGEQRRQFHSGTNFDVLACDEECKEPVYDESKRGLRTAKGGGRIIHAFTPPLPDDPTAGPSWTKWKLYDPYMDGSLVEPDLKIITVATYDNPAISEEFIRKFSQGKTPEQLKVQLYGQYPGWGKMVHPDFEDTIWNPKQSRGHLVAHDWEPPWYDDSTTVEFAVDWHPSKPAAAVWMSEDRDGNLFVFDELTTASVRDKTISEVCDIVRQVEGHPFTKPKVYRLGDPKMKDKSNALIRGFNAWEEFRNCGLYLHEAYNQQPGVGISIVNDFFRGNCKDHPRLFIRETCTTVRKALKNHFWRNDGSPDKQWDDYPTVIRYIVQRKARKLKKGMLRDGQNRRTSNWGLTSYEKLGKYGVYGEYVRR